MSETLVTIGTYLDVAEAHIAAGLLRSERIPVYPRDIDKVSANPLPGVGFDGVRLQVPARFEEAARSILANRLSSDEKELADLATGEGSKPEEAQSDCRVFGISSISNHVKRKEFWIRFALVDILLFALILLAVWSAS